MTDQPKGLFAMSRRFIRRDPCNESDARRGMLNGYWCAASMSFTYSVLLCNTLYYPLIGDTPERGRDEAQLRSIKYWDL